MSENHEICRDIEISYVEIAVKNWVRFAKVDTYVAYKSKNTSPNKAMIPTWTLHKS